MKLLTTYISKLFTSRISSVVINFPVVINIKLSNELITKAVCNISFPKETI